jgi:hypothetical protein
LKKTRQNKNVEPLDSGSIRTKKALRYDNARGKAGVIRQFGRLKTDQPL